MTDVTDATEPPGAVAIRRAIAAFGARDMDAFFALFADDNVYRVAGHNLVSGVYRGIPALQAFFVHLFEVTEGTMQVDIEDVLGSTDRAVMIFRVRASRKGKSLDDTGTMAFRVNDEGKFCESWLMYSHQVAYDEFVS
jgi:ketosteroid isomerase-like protein